MGIVQLLCRYDILGEGILLTVTDSIIQVLFPLFCPFSVFNIGPKCDQGPKDSERKGRGKCKDADKALKIGQLPQRSIGKACTYHQQIYITWDILWGEKIRKSKLVRDDGGPRNGIKIFRRLREKLLR